MSHELRTPLNAILGFSELISGDKSLANHHYESLTTIRNNGKHLLALINDVLQMSKIEAGKDSLVTSDFDLYNMLNDLEETMSFRAQKKGLILSFSTNSDVPGFVNTDERKLTQILINLVGNAIKFTDNGTVSVNTSVRKISSEPEEESVRLCFEVRDTGPGIAENKLATLFEAFFQADGKYNGRGGVGLGLAICKQLAVLMGGSITVESEFGKGSLFRVTIKARPALEIADNNYEEDRVVGLETKLAKDGKPYRILVVDDIDDNRQLMSSILKRVGFNIRQVCNGEDAIRVQQSWYPHLIWMDIRLPGIDGNEATKRIRNLCINKDCIRPVIIAITAHVFEEDQAKSLGAGCDDFISKPASESDILDMMSKHLGTTYTYVSQELEKLKSEIPETPQTYDFDDMPAELVEELKDAVELSDVVLIGDAIKNVSSHNKPLAVELGRLAHDFAYDRILDMIEKSQSDYQTPEI